MKRKQLKEYYSNYYNNNFKRDFGLFTNSTDLNLIKNKDNYVNDKDTLHFILSNHKKTVNGLLAGEITYYKSLEDYKKGTLNNRFCDRLFFDFDIETSQIDKIKEKINIQDLRIRSRYKKKFQNMILTTDLLLEPYKESKKLCEYLECMGLKPYLIASGSKGFHINLFFNELKLVNLSQINQKLGLYFKNKLNLKLLDFSVLGNHRTKQRVQYTYHSNTDLITTPISSDTNFDELLNILKNNKPKVMDFSMDKYISTEDFTNNLKDLDNKIAKTNYDKQLLKQKKIIQYRRYKNSTNKNILDIIRYYGVKTVKDYGNKVSCLCPFHSDNKASAVVFKDTNIFYCSACNIKYNYYDFIKEIEGISDKNKIMEIANSI